MSDPHNTFPPLRRTERPQPNQAPSAPSAPPVVGSSSGLQPIPTSTPTTDVDSLDSVFNETTTSAGHERLLGLLKDPRIAQITINDHRTIRYDSTESGKVFLNDVIFGGEAQYISWLNELLLNTDYAGASVENYKGPVIEASLREPFRGSIHLCTSEVTRGEPILTIRKQPESVIHLDSMVETAMMTSEMCEFLKLAIRGRLNILVSGGSGAGKTTLARALSAHIDPDQRVCTVEEIDELHLEQRLADVTPLTTFRKRDNDGVLIREVTLEALVREALRMRPDRIWVGETRGAEAYALVKACNSGHDGSLTTIHADDGAAAVKQAVTYVMEGGVAEQVARDQVARAFHLVVQIQRTGPTQRRITEITELEPALEGTEQRRRELYIWDHNQRNFMRGDGPSNQIIKALSRNGVTLGR